VKSAAERRFAEDLDRCLAGGLPGRIGVAVSGGGDSTALLCLMADWSKSSGIAIEAVTIDHNLRDAARAEARMAGETCAALGVPHETRVWAGWDGAGNLQDAARRARQRLIAQWAETRGIERVALGHTQDDQAETLVLRLARGSGVDGLSAMASRRTAGGLTWLRPLLGWKRAALRQLLRERNVPWADDPSNEDPQFARVRVRKILAEIAPLGLDVDALAATADRLWVAREALEIATQNAARQMARVTKTGDVALDTKLFADLPAESRSRLMAHALCWVATAPYPPRRGPLEVLIADVIAGRRGTLAGCLVASRDRMTTHICREPQAVAHTTAEPGAVWDGRWVLGHSGQNDGCDIRALGQDGLKACPDWRGLDAPRASLISLPAVWRGEKLVAAPLAGLGAGWSCRLIHGTDHFFASILSH